MIDFEVKKQFRSWTAFANSQGENPSNFKRKILRNIERLNIWLAPLGLEIKVSAKGKK